MKAEPDPHHVDVVKPGEERPEVKVARAVEALSEPVAAEHVVPEAVAAAKLPEAAKTDVAPAEPAVAVPDPGRPAAGSTGSCAREYRWRMNVASLSGLENPVRRPMVTT